jgi:hypothetical protein
MWGRAHSSAISWRGRSGLTWRIEPEQTAAVDATDEARLHVASDVCHLHCLGDGAASDLGERVGHHVRLPHLAHGEILRAESKSLNG